MVRQLLDGPQLTVSTLMMTGGLLQDIAQSPGVIREIRSKRYEFVVLQGAGLSQSHRHVYPHDGAVKLAKEAKDAGATALLFAEWPRRDVQETDYILGIYGKIARDSGAAIVPVCQAFDRCRLAHPTVELWAADGNHASLAGAYLAACRLALAIDPGAPLDHTPSSLSGDLGEKLRNVARRTPKI